MAGQSLYYSKNSNSFRAVVHLRKDLPYGKCRPLLYRSRERPPANSRPPQHRRCRHYFGVGSLLKYLGPGFLIFYLSACIFEPGGSDRPHGVELMQGQEFFSSIAARLEDPQGVLPDNEEFRALSGDFVYRDAVNWHQFFIFDRRSVLVLLNADFVYFVYIESRLFYTHFLNELEQIRAGLSGTQKSASSGPFLKRIGAHLVEIYFAPEEISFGSVATSNSHCRIRQDGNARPRPDIWRFLEAATQAQGSFPRFADQRMHVDLMTQIATGKQRSLRVHDVFLDGVLLPPAGNEKLWRKDCLKELEAAAAAQDFFQSTFSQTPPYAVLGEVVPFPYILGKELELTDNLLDNRNLFFENIYDLTRDFLALFSLPPGNPRSRRALSRDNGIVVLIRGPLDRYEAFLAGRSNAIELLEPAGRLRPGDLLITEVLYDINTNGACTEAEDEFVKVYNNTDKRVNLAGASIHYGTSTGNFTKRFIFDNYALSPGEDVAVVAKDAGCYTAAAPGSQRVLFKGSAFSFSASGATIALVRDGTDLPDGQTGPAVDPGSTVVLDHVGTESRGKVYEGSSRAPDCQDKSIVRLGGSTPVDTNENGADWACYSGSDSSSLDAFVMSPPQPMTPPIHPGDLLITEVLYDVDTSGACTEADDEFVKIYNNSASSVNLNGVSIQYGTGGTNGGNFSKRYLFGDYELGPEEDVAVIAKDAGCYTTTTPGSQRVLFKGSAFSFSASGATIALVRDGTNLPDGQTGPAVDPGSTVVLDHVGTESKGKVYEGSSRAPDCLDKSIVRLGGSTPVDTNENGTDWACYSGNGSSTLGPFIMTPSQPMTPMTPMTPMLPSGLVISEVGTNYDGNAVNDHILLYNPTHSGISLNGFYIGRDAACNLSNGWTEFKALPNDTIPSHRYYLISRMGNSLDADATPWGSEVNDGSLISGYCVGLASSGIMPDSVAAVNMIDFISFKNSMLERGGRAGILPNGHSSMSPRAYRRGGRCRHEDTNDNAADFTRDDSPSAPKNSSAPACTP